MSQAMHTVEQTFHAAMTAAPIENSLRGCSRMIVAYSGGADSSALLFLMRQYCEMHGIPVLAVHVHHGIRGAEADRDAAFCSDTCLRLGVACRVEKVDAPAFGDAHGMGLEEAARTLRYDVLTRLAEETDGTLIATAHSADDNLETVLFRLARGTALDGLCGIPPVRGNIIRPLLGCGADDIRDYCRAANLPYVTDSTNTDTSYTRNYIREEITPLLKKISGAPHEAVGRLCASLRADADCLHKAAMDALADAAEACRVPLDRVASLHDAVLSRCIVILYENAKGTRRDLTAAQIGDVMRAVRAGGFSRVSLPGNMTAVIAGGEFSVENGRAEIPEADETFSAPLSWGVNRFPDYGFGILMTRAEGENIPETEEDWQNIYKLSIRTSIPFDTIKDTVRVRFRRGGDTVRIGGMTRSVKKLLNAAKIPPDRRPRLPIVCDGDGILWIPGLPVRDGASETASNQVYFAYFPL